MTTITHEALGAIDARFRSGNSIPVDRATVPRAEWEVLNAAFAALLASYEARIIDLDNAVTAQRHTMRDMQRQLMEQPASSACGQGLVAGVAPGEIDDARRLLARGIADGAALWRERCGQAKGYAAPVAAEAAPQAVDLDKLREFLARKMCNWRSHLPSNPNTPGSREIRTILPGGVEGETDYNNDVAIYREAISVLDTAICMIDDQRGASHGI